MALDWHNHIPPALRSAAYSASNGELAWPREAALDVVRILTDKSFTILGVDVWLATTPGPTPVIHDWSEYNARNIPGYAQSPAAFIEGFKWAADYPCKEEEPYFNFTVTGTGSPPLVPGDESP